MSDQSTITLSERLSRGPMTIAEVQQYATALAEALRRLHDRGSVMGALEPSRVMLSGPAVNLTEGEIPTAVTPYTSPEQLQGSPPDARSDIFAFGAIVHEMLSGRRAFQAATPEELRVAILEMDPAPLSAELAEFSRLTAKCLAKAPLQRFQRMQRVQMELKLLSLFSRRTGSENAAKADRMEDLVHSRIADLELRMGARIEAQAEKLRAAAETERALRTEVAALEARLGSRLDDAETRGARLEQQFAGHESRGIAVEQTVRAHGSSIESLESAVAQTDDLLERVVEALDSLEKWLAEQHDIETVAGRN